MARSDTIWVSGRVHTVAGQEVWNWQFTAIQDSVRKSAKPVTIVFEMAFNNQTGLTEGADCCGCSQPVSRPDITVCLFLSPLLTVYDLTVSFLALLLSSCLSSHSPLGCETMRDNCVCLQRHRTMLLIWTASCGRNWAGGSCNGLQRFQLGGRSAGTTTQHRSCSLLWARGCMGPAAMLSTVPSWLAGETLGRIHLLVHCVSRTVCCTQ